MAVPAPITATYGRGGRSGVVTPGGYRLPLDPPGGRWGNSVPGRYEIHHKRTVGLASAGGPDCGPVDNSPTVGRVMGGRRRTWPRSARLLVVLLALLTLPLSASAAAPEDDLKAAQERANRAAAELAEAEEALAEAEDAVAHLQSRVATLDARVGATRVR